MNVLRLCTNLLILLTGGILIASVLLGSAVRVPPRVDIAFPPEPLQSFENSSQLLSFLEEALEIPPSTWSSRLINTSSGYLCCLYDWRNHSLPLGEITQVLSGTGPIATLWYTGDGRLISISVLGPFGRPFSGGLTLDTAIARLEAMANAFGISALPAEKIAWGGHGFVRMNGTTLYVPTLTVVLYADRAGLPLGFGNEIRIIFDAEHEVATELVVYPWIVASNPLVSKAEAYTIALDYINQTNPQSALSRGEIYFAFDFLHSSLAYQVEASYGNAASPVSYRVWVDAYLGRITYAVEIIPPPSGTLTGLPMPSSGERPSQLGLYGWIQVGVITASVLTLLSIINVEAATIATLLVIMPLYMRIKKDHALDHFLRGQLYNHIVSNPGVTYSEIKNAFGLNNGTTTYHLAVLEVLGYIHSSRERKRRTYSPVGLEKGDVRRTVTRLQQAILGVVRAHGAAAPSDIARLVGISRQRASYNLRRMAEYGLVHEDERFHGRYRMRSGAETQREHT